MSAGTSSTRVGEIGRAVLDVVEQPPNEAVLQCFSVHRDSSSQ